MLLLIPLSMALTEEERVEFCNNVYLSTNSTNLTHNLMNGQVGTVVGGNPTLVASGGVNNSAYIDFDGLADKIEYNGSGNFSELWNVSVFFWSLLNPTGSIDTVIAKGDNIGISHWLFNADDRAGQKNIHIDDVGTGGITKLSQPNTDLLGTWNMYSFSLNTTINQRLHAHLFVNDTEVGFSIDTDAGYNTSINNIGIGSDMAGSSNDFNGFMTLIMIYNGTSNQSIVESVYNETRSGRPFCPFNVTVAPPVADTQNPNFNVNTINNTAPRNDETVGLSIVVNDETALSSYRLADNRTGTFINSTAFTIGGTSSNATFNMTLASQFRGDVVGYEWHVSDSAGNTNTSGIFTFAIANTPPGNATILFPTESLTTFLQPLDINVTFENDADSDPITIFYYINDVLNQTSSVNTTLNASDSEYTLKVSLFDGLDFGVNTTRTFILDTANPIITVEAPLNNTLHNSDIAVGITCTNINLLNLSYVFHNSTDILQAEFNSTVNATESKLQVPITATGLDGQYQLNVSCLDNASLTTKQFLILDLDTTAPAISTAISNATPQEAEVIQINGTCTDNQLGSVAIANNQTGALTNITIVAVPGSTTYIHNHTVVLGTISHQYTCTDSASNSIQSGLISYTSSPGPAVDEPTEAEAFTSNFTSAIATVAVIMILIVVLVIVATIVIKAFSERFKRN